MARIDGFGLKVPVNIGEVTSNREIGLKGKVSPAVTSQSEKVFGLINEGSVSEHQAPSLGERVNIR